ncbi:MAG TPA: Hsp20/alpha crystallin family protein [Gemmatimonadaceae bacterium]|nr:Hsp20/alpha crystallin family protein [Gemmatimonadaceae bacterium]
MAYRGGGLTPFGGFAPLFSLRRDIDRLFEDTFSGRGAEGWTPAVNIREGQNEIALDFELPGIDPEQVDVSVDNGLLTVSGEKREESKEGDEGRYHLVERRYGSFARSFTLPQGVSEDQIRADFHNGVLTVHIPKAALPQPRKIQIGHGKREQQQVSSGATGQGRETTGGRSTGTRGESGSGSRKGSQQQDRMVAGSGNEEER